MHTCLQHICFEHKNLVIPRTHNLKALALPDDGGDRTDRTPEKSEKQSKSAFGSTLRTKGLPARTKSYEDMRLLHT